MRQIAVGEDPLGDLVAQHLAGRPADEVRNDIGAQGGDEDDEERGQEAPPNARQKDPAERLERPRAEVSGGTRKPFRQKGTGRARQGANNTPLMPGGGRAFGPRPRDYRTELPRRQRRAALASALSQLASANAVTVLESLSFPEPKTRQMAEVLERLGLADKRTLLVVEQADVNLLKSCRNLRNLRTTLAHQV
ncbi:MAG: 50S ribosomal protein L4, partial [Actinobacteria bacterium]